MVDRQTLLKEASETGFRPEIQEKVIWLLQLLEGFQEHPYLRSRFVLKGGTAINLFYYDLPRLSVDIDLNYIGALDLEAMQQERPIFESAIEAICKDRGLTSVHIPGSHAGGKWQLRYPSAIRSQGNLELDLNYLFRQVLWPVEHRDSFQIGSSKSNMIPVLALSELAAGKLAALFSRKKARDVFDTILLHDRQEINRDETRLGFMVYGAMNRKDWRTVSPNNIEVSDEEVQNQLIPVLRRGYLGDQDVDSYALNLTERCREVLSYLFPFREEEIAFLDALRDHGEIRPEFLTGDPEMFNVIQTHPGLAWRARQSGKSGPDSE